jgi:L-lactate dehydrogenase complex protein LldF
VADRGEARPTSSESRLARPAGSFRAQARRALADAHTQAALDLATDRLRMHRLEAWAGLDDVEALRERGREARTRAIRELPRHLDEFERALEARGGRVHRCATDAEALAAILEICHAAGAKLVAKSKSMASEEIHLNAALEAEGIRVVETDLGEYIVQLAGEHPAHILAPAIEKTAEDVAQLLAAVDGEPVEPGPELLTAKARRQLREVFLTADVGVTGVNFAVAETGSICLVTNEGNGRLVSALPRVHVAILGMERVVATMQDLAICLELLARSATGQRLSTYTTLLTGPRRRDEQDGPEELHVIVLDNGRSALRGTRYEEMLNCIRCGACLNVCPVYRKAGGAAYGPVYSGPMGAVLVPLLARAQDLPHASSLCGACTDACPVKIPLHALLLELRRDLVADGTAPWHERLAFTLWSLAWSTPLGYRLSTALARAAQPIVPLAARPWARGRALPRLRRRYRDR